MSKLDELLRGISGKGRVFIQMHNSPDPDAIASAFGLQYLLRENGIGSEICYTGLIDKYSTQRMIELLNIKVSNSAQIDNSCEEKCIILVDSQKGNSNVEDFSGSEVISIDHHPVFNVVEYIFADIRPEIGACSTIIAQYFVDNLISIPIDVATSLLYGIKIDTLNLSRGVSDLDLDMFFMLYKISNIDLLNKLQVNAIQYNELIAYGNAIKNIKVYGSIGFANIGIDCPDSLLGTISDFIISIKEVDFSIVYSPRESGIKFSLRSEADNLDAGKIAFSMLDGIGNGGGHKFMAGGFLPSQNLSRISGELESFLEDGFLDIIKSYKVEDTKGNALKEGL